MKALTLKQPYATAIIFGGKDIENRTQLWSHRGPLAIHAGVSKVRDWSTDSLLRTAVDRWRVSQRLDGHAMPPQGVIVGVVEVVDAHFETGGCCAPWGHRSTTLVGPGGSRKPYRVVHMVLQDARPLPDPIPTKGRLGLWDLDVDTERRLVEQIGVR